MSTSPPPPDPINPYETPQTFAPQPFQQPMGPPPHRGIPTLSKVMFIVSLIICLLRVPLVFFAFVGLMMIQQGQGPVELLPTVWFEIGSGAALAGCGILANGLMLAKIDWAVKLGYLTVLAVLFSIGVGIWQAMLQVGLQQPGTPEQAGMMIGIVLVIGFRLTLLGLYVAALIQFAAWTQQREQQVPQGF